jgi:signal transduction histidine kinase
MKEVQKLRQELTANISHDLRSPIAVSQGYIETMLMKKEELNATEREKYLEIVLASMGKLTKLVAQLFEYSKLQANQVKLEKEAFSIEELASDVVANYKGIADNRNIELKLSADKEMSLVFADIALVDRVLQNLMDNALKYTPDGGLITLQIHSNNENVSFTIQDSGPGIPEGEQLLIFERYVHGTKKGGTGLGLAIVKRIIDLHNTKIEVLSRPDEGAAFRFELQTVL